MEAAYARLDAAFEFFSKLGVDYYCFHDRDLAPEGNDANESEEYLQQLTQAAKRKQETKIVHKHSLEEENENYGTKYILKNKVYKKIY